MAEGRGPAALSAIVIGATGAVGKCLVGSLLKAKDKVAKVTVITRRKVNSVAESYGVDVKEEEEQGRLVQHVEDLETVKDDTVKELCTGSHVFFNCLGTTRRTAGSAAAFRRIDYEMPLRLIKIAKEAGVGHCSVVTSVGSNPNSWFLYMKTKGEMEVSVKEEKFEYASIFRPGLLDRGEGNMRFVEKITRIFIKAMPVSSVATAMLQDAWTHHSSSTQEGAATSNEVTYDNAGIYRLCEEFSEE